MVKKVLGIAALGLSSLSFACPSVNQAQQVVNKIFRVPLKVVDVKGTPIKGLCEMVASFNNRKIIFYIDESGRYFLLGRGPFVNILDLKTGQNITENELQELNKLSEKQVHELDKYVAFTYGTKGKVVYLFTDPECPFCQRLEPTLKKLADEGKIQVKVILFPLPFHRYAKKKAVAMVCQNIGWKGLRNNYWTPERMEKLEQWQCTKGEKLVNESIKIGQKYGVSGTPTIITQSGKKIVGALPEKQLEQALGLQDNNTK